MNAPAPHKSRDRTPQEARSLLNTLRRSKPARKRTYRVALALGDPPITTIHPFTNYLVEQAVIASERLSRADDEIFNLQWKLARLKAESERQRAYLKVAADSIGDILNGTEPPTDYVVRYIKHSLNLWEYVEPHIELSCEADAWHGPCPLSGHKGDSHLKLYPRHFDCSGCNVVNGDLIEFVRRFYQVSFLEAVRRLRKDALNKTRERNTRAPPP